MQRRRYLTQSSHRDRGAQPAKRELARRLRRDKTPAEQVLWAFLRQRQLDGVKFRDQHTVAGFVLDFYAPSARLAIELDGEVHTRQREYDDARTSVLRRLGITVMRIENRVILHDVTQALEAIRAALALTP